MQDSIFREYDIRGKVGSELVLADMYDLGCAIAYYFKEQDSSVRRVVVGMDARLTSPRIKDDICHALMDSGLDVTFIGVCPSPVLYFGMFTLPVDAGLMITASHNPPEYNGIKVGLKKKFVWGNQIRYIGQLFRERKKIVSEYEGVLTDLPLISEYVAWIKDHFPRLDHMALRAVVDVGNTTGATVIPELIKAFGWQHVKQLCGDIYEQHPRHEADPVVEKNMICVKEALATKQYDVGIGLDGDCDRMGAMTATGYLLPGDRLLAIFAQPIVQQHPGTAVVFDIKSSSGLNELLEKWGSQAIMSPSGHAILKETMQQHHALLGGELSCHFFFYDRYFGYDDGIYAMLRLFEIMVETNKSLDELYKIFPPRVSSPEYRIPCSEEKKQPIIAAVKDYFMKEPEAHILTIDGVRATLPYGWGIVRASNTQPVLSIRFEANTAQNLVRIKEEFIKALAGAYTSTILRADFEL